MDTLMIGKPYIKDVGDKARLCSMLTEKDRTYEMWFEVESQYGQYLCTERIEKSKIISTFAPATFGVFLIHTHQFLLNWLCTVLMGDISQGSWLLVIPKLLFAAILVFLICGVVELVRLRIVKLCKIKAWLSKMEQRLVVRA